MKTGVSSYSFSRLISNGSMSEFDAIKKASEMGFDVIEFSGLRVPQGQCILDYAKRIKEACASVGIEMGNYTIGADFLTGSDGNWEAEVERVKKEVDVAAALGSPGMRHDATRGFKQGYTGTSTFEAALPVLIKACRLVTEYAEQFGIRTMVENHGFFCQDSERIEKLISGVNHANFGALVDMGNFLCVDEDPTKAVGKLMSVAFHVHAKDFHVKSGISPFPGTGWFESRGGNYLRGAIIGHGDVPVQQIINIIKKAGYDGTVSIEFEGMEEPLQGISLGLENLKRFIS